MTALTSEGGGFVLACQDCGWERFYVARSDAEAGRTEHAKKCKGPKQAKADAAKPRPQASWNDREGETWIDQL